MEINEIANNVDKMNSLLRSIKYLDEKIKDLEKIKNTRNAFRLNEQYFNFNDNVHDTIKRILIADAKSKVTKLQKELKNMYTAR